MYAYTYICTYIPAHTEVEYARELAAVLKLRLLDAVEAEEAAAPPAELAVSYGASDVLFLLDSVLSGVRAVSVHVCVCVCVCVCV